MKTATIKDINEERKKPIPTNSGPIFPKIYENGVVKYNFDWKGNDKNTILSNKSQITSKPFISYNVAICVISPI